MRERSMIQRKQAGRAEQARAAPPAHPELMPAPGPASAEPGHALARLHEPAGGHQPAPGPAHPLASPLVSSGAPILDAPPQAVLPPLALPSGLHGPGLIQRDDKDSVDGAATPVAVTTPPELEAFRKHGPYPSDAAGQQVQPETGLGGFNARYDPADMQLKIMVNIAMTFVDGLSIEGQKVKANDPRLEALAKKVNRMRGKEREQALEKIRADWQWNGSEEAWMTQYRQQVGDTWSSGQTSHIFQSSSAGWDDQLGKVQVAISTTKASAAATPGDPAAAAVAAGPQPVHCRATVLKTRDDISSMSAEVGSGKSDDPTDQTLSLTSGHLITPDTLEPTQVLFANNSAQLNAGAREQLNRFIISFQAPDGGAGTSIDITGRASSTGSGTPEGDERNQALSQDRASAVAEYLRNTEVEGRKLANADLRISSEVGTGSVGAGEEAEWRRVELLVGGGISQKVAAHEFGHMIGLDDEYASTPKLDKDGNPVLDKKGDAETRGLIGGTGGEVGAATETDDLATRMGLGGSVYENNESVMSLGSTVMPRHYATFMQALRELTASDAWKLKDS